MCNFFFMILALFYAHHKIRQGNEPPIKTNVDEILKKTGTLNSQPHFVCHTIFYILSTKMKTFQSITLTKTEKDSLTLSKSGKVPIAYKNYL